jgi:hypothetical protein
MYRLTREQDNKVIEGEKINYIEWDEDGRFSKQFDEPTIGRSIILDPHYFKYSWMTTEITSFTKDGDKLIFSTKNSNYILESI